MSTGQLHANAVTGEVEKQVYDLRRSHAALVQRPATSQNVLVKAKSSALQQAAQIQQQREMAFGGFMMRPGTVYNASHSMAELDAPHLRAHRDSAVSSIYGQVVTHNRGSNSRSPDERMGERMILGRNASTSDLEPLPLKSKTKHTIEIKDQ